MTRSAALSGVGLLLISSFAAAAPPEVRGFRNMLATVRDRVAGMLAQGMTEEQVVAALPTKEFDATWTGDAERLVRAVFRGVASR